ncbi:MAG: hypothetical protein JWP94_2929 [Mucilaginibacter sp.]|nr:hypothetical protein [Mucilaginibacter sp.]
MPQFISKVQHYISEKGEFADEKARTPAQTLELIKDFPWQEERPFSDLKIGPSVTIQDENSNYLKVVLGSDRIFSINFLDNDNHLYEYNVLDIDTVCIEATSFFSGQVNIQNYKKHFFNIGNRVNFLTKDFIYNVKALSVLWLSSLQIIPFFAITLFLVELSPNASFSERAFLILLFLLSGGLCGYILNRYLVCYSQTLQISKGNDIFYFGQGLDEKKYNKNDIEKIVIYSPGGKRKLHFFYVFEIYFMDRSILKFSNMLISEGDFFNKFPSDVITYGAKSPFWKL